MLTPKAQMSLRHAKAYFREHLSAGDYYSQGQQVAGQWFGLGAEKLGLHGVVTEQEFLRLCEGRHPHTGEKLTQRLNKLRRSKGSVVANRRVFYDFTISPPKSVSAVALLCDARIVQVHDAAVRDAMTELERLAGARVRKAGASHSRTTGAVVAAAFRHDTSRELDPHLHTHCIVLNATFDPVEKRWKALQAVDLFRAQKLAEHCYYHTLCRGLRGLGYEIELNRRDFEIKGVPATVIATFSKRRAEIDAEAKRRLARGETEDAAEVVRARVAREVRRGKTRDAPADRLRESWRQQLSRSDLAALRDCAGRPKPAAPADVKALAAWADEHVFERRAVATEPELLAAALARGRGLDFDLAALRRAVAARDYVREPESLQLTSREVLRCELELVFAARDGRGAHASLAPDFTPSAKLSAEQDRAVRQILGSRDSITLFRGGAGTGKSFALREVHRGLVAAGHAVVVVTPQRQQALDLTRDGLPADTLAHVLAARELPARAVVLVDEAGQIGGRQLRALMRLAQTQRARLILSGDTRQHGAVEASDALRAIEAYGQIPPAEVSTIRRQDPARAKSAGERVTIERYRAAVQHAAAGDTSASLAILDRLGWVREAGDADRHAAISREYVAATHRGESALVVAPTWHEVHAVNGAIRAELARRGQLGAESAVMAFQAVDSTVAQRRDPAFYQSEHHAHFVQRYGRFAKGEVCPVVGATEKGLVILKGGRRSTVSFRYADRIAIVTPTPLTLAAGDRLQLKFNGRSAEGRAFANGELVTVRRMHADGRIVVVDEAGVTKTLSAVQRVFHLGYAITSYGSQGKTVDRVLLADAGTAATNRNQWYVAISRGRKQALVFTANRRELRAVIPRDGDRPLAVELKTAAKSAATRSPSWAARARHAIALLHRTRFFQNLRSSARTVRQRL